MIIRKEIEINNSIENVWQVLGHDFAQPYKWASAVNHSEGQGEAIGSISCDERACQTTMGNIREKLTQYSDAQHHLAYDITEGLPGFIHSASNSWQLQKAPGNTTILQIEMEFEFKPWALFMAPLAKGMFHKMARQLTEDFAHYATHGTPHPRKKKAMEKTTSKGSSLFYLFAFVLGTGIPLYFIYQFIQEAGSVDLALFAQQLFANPAASTFSSDLLICSFIFWVFMLRDKKGKELPHLLYFIGLNLSIGLSAALPLYFYFRERRKR